MIGISAKGITPVSENFRRINEELSGPPMRETMRMATLIVTRSAKIFSPVDTGRLRASITPEVKTAFKHITGVVGSIVEYAPFQEERRHYLQRGWDDNKDRVIRMFNQDVGQIIED